MIDPTENKRMDGSKVRPVCSYVRRFLIRFPEYQLLVAPR